MKVLALLISIFLTLNAYALPTYYTVRRGDSLYRITRKFRISPRELVRLNHLKKPYKLKIGQRLRLKPYAEKPRHRVKHEATRYSLLRKVPIYKHYRIRSGDSVYKIARRFHVKERDVIVPNHMRKPYRLRIGQRIRILVGYKDRLKLNRAITFKFPIDARVDPTVMKRGYPGVFFVSPPDVPVKASETGIVAYAGNNKNFLGAYGNIIIMEHAEDYRTVYGSLGKIYVRPGQLVRRGEIIGTSGISGDWRKSGLYFAIAKVYRGKVYPINPLDVLK